MYSYVKSLFSLNFVIISGKFYTFGVSKMVPLKLFLSNTNVVTIFFIIICCIRYCICWRYIDTCLY